MIYHHHQSLSWICATPPLPSTFFILLFLGPISRSPLSVRNRSRPHTSSGLKGFLVFVKFSPQLQIVVLSMGFEIKPKLFHWILFVVVFGGQRSAESAAYGSKANLLLFCEIVLSLLRISRVHLQSQLPNSKLIDTFPPFSGYLPVIQSFQVTFKWIDLQKYLEILWQNCNLRNYQDLVKF